MSTRTKKRFEFIGWVVFLLSAICYTWAGIRAGDLLSVSGSLLFLGACFLFIVPGLTAETSSD